MAKDEAPVKVFEDLNPKNFDRSTVIDNPWMPLKPGTRFTYKGTNIEDDATPVPHQVVITITDLTTVISGIRTASYSQGWAPAVNFTDRGQVDQTGQKTYVPVKCYDDVLVIAEDSGEEKDAQQLKHFARRVGNILVAWRGKGEKTKQTLQLVSVEELDVAALAEARAGAIKLEKSAYERSKTIYAHTLPAEHPAGAKSDKPTTPKEAQR